MDKFEDYVRDEEDFSADYAYEEYGPQYAADHAADIAKDFQSSGLLSASLEAHEKNYDLANKQICKAKDRLSSENWDEAVFHAGRALDGYAKAVFVDPFRELALKPFYDAFPHVNFNKNTIIKPPRGFGGSADFLYFGIAATAGEKETIEVISDIKSLITGGNKTSGWSIRNSTDHSLRDPSKQEATLFVEKIENLMERLSLPLVNLCDVPKTCERLARESLEESMAWRI